MNQRVVVALGIVGVFFSVFLGVFLIIPWQVAGVLVAVSIGVSTLLLHYERGKSNVSISQSKSEEKGEKQKVTIGSPLLPDPNQFVKLRIDNTFLDQIYKKAQSIAENTYADAQLSHFTIQGSFDEDRPTIAIYFDFYSKWANKICNFQYTDLTSQLKHHTPNKSAMKFQKGVFNNLPWKTSPHFLQALSLAYDKVKPLPATKGTFFHLHKNATQENWDITFDDGISGNDYHFDWDGQGLDENSIRQVI